MCFLLYASVVGNPSKKTVEAHVHKRNALHNLISLCKGRAKVTVNHTKLSANVFCNKEIPQNSWLCLNWTVETTECMWTYMSSNYRIGMGSSCFLIFYSARTQFWFGLGHLRVWGRDMYDDKADWTTHQEGQIQIQVLWLLWNSCKLDSIVSV